MKPFNLQEAIAGKPIMTRDGDKVKFIAYVPEADCNEKIVILKYGTIYAYLEDGTDGHDTDEDLVMAPEKRILYVNVYNCRGDGNGDYEADAYLTKKGAIEQATDNLFEVLVTAHPIEIEV